MKPPIDGPWPINPGDPLPPIEFDPDAPWQGKYPRPAPIPPATAPGGLVFVVLAGDGTEVDRVAVSDMAAMQAADVEHQAELCAGDPSLHLVIFDGDTGLAVAAMHTEEQ